jgi:hypothetical protein
MFLGLKPQAESCSPFGTKADNPVRDIIRQARSPKSTAYHSAGPDLSSRRNDGGEARNIRVLLETYPEDRRKFRNKRMKPARTVCPPFGKALGQRLCWV